MFVTDVVKINLVDWSQYVTRNRLYAKDALLQCVNNGATSLLHYTMEASLAWITQISQLQQTSIAANICIYIY